jgi:hypothetical protein
MGAYGYLTSSPGMALPDAEVTNSKQCHLGVLAIRQDKSINASPLFIVGDSYGQKVKPCFDVRRSPFENAR